MLIQSGFSSLVTQLIIYASVNDLDRVDPQKEAQYYHICFLGLTNEHQKGGPPFSW
jgi:hypothetical protein